MPNPSACVPLRELTSLLVSLLVKCSSRGCLFVEQRISYESIPR